MAVCTPYRRTPQPEERYPPPAFCGSQAATAWPTLPLLLMDRHCTSLVEEASSRFPCRRQREPQPNLYGRTLLLLEPILQCSRQRQLLSAQTLASVHSA